MKKAIATLAQTILFLLLFAVGSFLTPFHLQHVIATAPEIRLFIFDGVVLMLAVYLLLLVIAGLRKRLPLSAPWATLALVLATVLGLAMKLGFKTIDRY